MNKKKIVLYSILCAVALAFVLIPLFTPIVHIVAKNTAETIAYDKSVSLIEYIKDAPFWNTGAYDIYFNANGPVWVATGAILAFSLICVFGLILFLLCVFELVTIKKQNLNVKNNVLTKKLALFFGYFALGINIFSIASFFITTALANGYLSFYVEIGTYALFGTSVVAIIVSHLLGKRKKEQNFNKTKNALGFGFCAFFAAILCGFMFVPAFAPELLGFEYTSFFTLSKSASELVSDPYILNTMGDYPIGFMQYAIFALMFASAFIFVYGFIGFILTLCGKKTNFLSSKIKRWSMTFLVVYYIVYLLAFCSIAVLSSTLIFDETSAFMPVGYLLALMPILPYCFASFISVNKK